MVGPKAMQGRFEGEGAGGHAPLPLRELLTTGIPPKYADMYDMYSQQFTLLPSQKSSYYLLLKFVFDYQ